MEEKLLNERSIDDLVNQINKVVEEHFLKLDQKDNIEKWNGVPKLYLLDEEKQEKILDFTEYLDTLLIPIYDKALYVISLSGVIEFMSFKVEKYDNGSLLLLASFYQDSDINYIKSTFYLTGNQALLLAIRNKTLDMDVRKKILLSFVNQAFYDKIDGKNKKELTGYIRKYIEDIESKDYYELAK